MQREMPQLLFVGGRRAFGVLPHVFERMGFAIAAVRTGEEALTSVRRAAPAVVAVDHDLEGLSAYELCHELRAEHGNRLPVVVVSARPLAGRERVAALLLGADDAFVAPYDAEEVAVRIRRLAARAPSEPVDTGLTRREREVLELLATGVAQAEIAARLVISGKTVSTHVQHILLKLGAHSRAEAVAVAYRDGIIVPPARRATNL